MLKTSFALTILFSVVPVVIALFSRRERWPGRVLVVLLGLIAAGAVLRTEQVLAASDPVAKSFLPTSLFTIHAKLIARQMDEDLARGQCGARGCDWLRQIEASLHEEIEKSRHSWRLWRSLGFYPDYLMYEDSLRRWRARFFDGDTGRQLEFYTYYYLRTLQMHPGRMAAKVIDQLAQFYLGYKKSLLATPQVKLAPRYAHTLNDLQPYLSATASYPPFARYLKEVERLSSSNDTLNQPVIVTLVGGLLAFLYPPVFFATVGTVCFLPPRLRRLYGSLALIALFAFSYNFGNCLGTAILHSLDVTRYIVVQYSFTLLAECIGLLFLVDLGLEQLRANRSAS